PVALIGVGVRVGVARLVTVERRVAVLLVEVDIVQVVKVDRDVVDVVVVRFAHHVRIPSWSRSTPDASTRTSTGPTRSTPSSRGVQRTPPLPRRARQAPGPIVTSIQAHGCAGRFTRSRTGPSPESSTSTDPTRSSTATPRTRMLRRTSRRPAPGG